MKERKKKTDSGGYRSASKKQDSKSEMKDYATVGYLIFLWIAISVFTIVPPVLSIFTKYIIALNHGEKLILSALFLPEFFLAVFAFTANTICSLYLDRQIGEIKKRLYLIVDAVMGVISFLLYILDSAVVNATGDAARIMFLIAVVIVIVNAFLGVSIIVTNEKAKKREMGTSFTRSYVTPRRTESSKITNNQKKKNAFSNNSKDDFERKGGKK